MKYSRKNPEFKEEVINRLKNFHNKYTKEHSMRLPKMHEKNWFINTLLKEKRPVAVKKTPSPVAVKKTPSPVAVKKTPSPKKSKKPPSPVKKASPKKIAKTPNNKWSYQARSPTQGPVSPRLMKLVEKKRAKNVALKNYIKSQMEILNKNFNISIIKK